jgi:putative transposase
VYLPVGSPPLRAACDAFYVSVILDKLSRILSRHKLLCQAFRRATGRGDVRSGARLGVFPLGYRTPAEYAAGCRCTHTAAACEIN